MNKDETKLKLNSVLNKLRVDGLKFIDNNENVDIVQFIKSGLKQFEETKPRFQRAGRILVEHVSFQDEDGFPFQLTERRSPNENEN